jgi:type II restriction endonuclease EcoO109I-like protein
MKKELRKLIEQFVHENIGSFHARRTENIRALKLSQVLLNKNPYLFRAKNLNRADELVSALLDARQSSAEEGSFGGFLEELAIYVARITVGGEKSGVEGIDIELTRDKVRHLIAVKSGRNWGNASQHARLRENFRRAVRVLRQSKYVGEIQPTLGIAYGKFKTVNNGEFLHIGGQSFWHLISGDTNFYVDLIEPLGHDAERLNEEFEQEKNATYNRFTREFVNEYCDADGKIDWSRLVRFVSANFEELPERSRKHPAQALPGPSKLRKRPT